eukprot:350422-Chlamydomonas_euryale.AAC.3
MPGWLPTLRYFTRAQRSRQQSLLWCVLVHHKQSCASMVLSALTSAVRMRDDEGERVMVLPHVTTLKEGY